MDDLRQWLGRWGADLDDDMLACAVAAAGLQRNVVEHHDGLICFWRWPHDRVRHDPHVLAAAWREGVARRGPLRLAIARITEPVPGLSFAVQRLLNRRAVVGEGSVHVALMPTAEVPPLRWPLDVAAWPIASFDLAGGAPRQLGRRHWRASVLLLSGGIAALARLPASTRVAAVVLLDPPPVDAAQRAALVDAIVARTHARAIVASHGFGPSFWSMIRRQLAQDVAFDLAAVQAADGDDLLLAGDLLTVRLGREPRWPEAGRPFDAQFKHTIDVVQWRSPRPLPDPPTISAPPPESRHLRARVTVPGGDDMLTTLERRRAYEIQVSIGGQLGNFLRLIPPVLGLPQGFGNQRLTVVFTDPVLAPRPRVATLELPPLGDSEPCRFRIETTPDTERLEARIALIHDGRTLQTGVLRGACDGVSPITFDVDAAARAVLVNLDERTHFGATVIANHTDGGTPGFVAATAAGKAARLSVSEGDVKNLTRALGTVFDLIKNDPRPQRSLRDASNVQALRNLAQHGALFHESLKDDSGVADELLGDDPIQVVNARRGAFLPIELTYRYPAPKRDAELCPHAEAGLAAGTCQPACGGGTAERVCPLGFWSLARVIERVAYRPRELGGEGDYGVSIEPLRDRARLLRPTAAVVGASERANKRVATSVADLAARLSATFAGATVEPAVTWQSWKQRLHDAPGWPALLVLVPHHENEESFDILEIGGDHLRSTEVEGAHVVGEPARGQEAPIVLLLGCETQLAEISHESFVHRFRKHGAAVVVGTIATVLGLDAAPVAADLADAIMAEFGATPPRSLGEVMLRVRRNLVAAGRVMVLSLSADGDADWELA